MNIYTEKYKLNNINYMCLIDFKDQVNKKAIQ